MIKMRHTRNPTQVSDGEPQGALDPVPSLALLEVAGEIASGVRALVPSCTCAVVVPVGSAWQVVGQSGNVDVISRWPGKLAHAVARQVAGTQRDADHLVTAFAGDVGCRLLLVAEADLDIPPWATEAVDAVLAQGGALIDRAVAAQQRDRAIRRIALAHRDDGAPSAPPLEVLGAAMASLWSGGTVSYHGRGGRSSEPLVIRRLVRAACDLDCPAFDHAAPSGAVLRTDARRRIAVPDAAHRGAFVLEMPIAGEELDAESVAAAAHLVRVAGLLARQEALTSEMRALRRGRRHASGMDIHPRLTAPPTFTYLTDQIRHAGLAHSNLGRRGAEGPARRRAA